MNPQQLKLLAIILIVLGAALIVWCLIRRVPTRPEGQAVAPANPPTVKADQPSAAPSSAKKRRRRNRKR